MKGLFAAVLFLAAPAFADAPPPYVPFTVNEQDYKALQTYLGDQPMKFGAPIAAWLTVTEQKAAADKAKADADAAKPKDPPK